MNVLRAAKYVILAIVLVLVGGFLHYNLPRTAVVQVTGTDVKRLDRGPSENVASRDVRFISARSQNGKIWVFRNEDTGWGWPPYFKFDSATLTAEAQTFASEADKPWVLVRYYGWRVDIFSLFPNAISLKVVDRDHANIPIFNIIVLLVLAGVAFFVWRLMARVADKIDPD